MKAIHYRNFLFNDKINVYQDHVRIIFHYHKIKDIGYQILFIEILSVISVVIFLWKSSRCGASGWNGSLRGKLKEVDTYFYQEDCQHHNYWNNYHQRLHDLPAGSCHWDFIAKEVSRYILCWDQRSIKWQHPSLTQTWISSGSSTAMGGSWVILKLNQLAFYSILLKKIN